MFTFEKPPPDYWEINVDWRINNRIVVDIVKEREKKKRKKKNVNCQQYRCYFEYWVPSLSWGFLGQVRMTSTCGCTYNTQTYRSYIILKEKLTLLINSCKQNKKNKKNRTRKIEKLKSKKTIIIFIFFNNNSWKII